jgi:Ca2+-binding RTX toxin-like protein
MGVGFSGTETFDYTVSDGNGGTNDSTLTINLAGANDAPMANDDTATVNEDATTANLAASLVSNDTDPDTSDVLRITAVTQGAKGSVFFDAGTAAAGDETVTYTADGNVLDSLAVGESTTDTFTYTVSDGNGGSDTATVTVTINGVNNDLQAPTDLILSNNSVQEDSLNGTLVGTLTTVDADDASGFTYALTDSANGIFAVNSSTGQITIVDTEKIDFELAPNHNITVQVTDNDGQSYSEIFTINITDRATNTTGTNGPDLLEGTSAGETISGSGDNDVIFGGGGNDILNGGNGEDRLYGQTGNDTLNGEQNNDIVLDGGSGNDILVGGQGTDLLIGGTGADTMTGNGQVDTFRFNADDLGTGVDTITDFELAGGQADKLQIGELLVGYDGNTANLGNFVQVTNDGTNTTIAIDANGTVGGSTYTNLVVLQGVATNLASLLPNLDTNNPSTPIV